MFSMPIYVILFTVALFAIHFSWKKGDRITLLQSIGLGLGIALGGFESLQIKMAGMFLFTLSALLLSITSFKNSKIRLSHRFISISSGIMTILVNSFEFLHFPYANELNLAVFIPILAYVTGLFTGFVKEEAFGNVTLINTLLLLRFF